MLAGWHAGHPTPVVPQVACWQVGSGLRDKEVSLGHQESSPHRLWTHKWASPRQTGREGARGGRRPACMRGEDGAEVNSGKFSRSGCGGGGVLTGQGRASQPLHRRLDPLGRSEGTKGPLQEGSEGQSAAWSWAAKDKGPRGIPKGWGRLWAEESQSQ